MLNVLEKQLVFQQSRNSILVLSLTHKSMQAIYVKVTMVPFILFWIVNTQSLILNSSRFSSWQVVKMLIVVVAMFGICWMPLHILNVILNFRPELSSRADDTIAAIYISAHWLAMANSFANPIIYSFTNSIFRVIFLGHVSYLYLLCQMVNVTCC